MTTVRMNVSAIGGLIQLPYTGSIVPAADGTAIVDSRDAPVLLAAGATYMTVVTRRQAATAPLAATAGRLVASTALSNGALSVANQPDVPRQGVLRVSPGTSAITAGQIAIPYLANDGTSQTDVVSLVMPGTTVVSTITSKGILVLSAPVVSGLVGGASPLVQINDTNSLSMMVDPGFVDFSVLREDSGTLNEGQVAVASSAASLTPSTTPNGTISYNVYYSYVAPSV